MTVSMNGNERGGSHVWRDPGESAQRGLLCLEARERKYVVCREADVGVEEKVTLAARTLCNGDRKNAF